MENGRRTAARTMNFDPVKNGGVQSAKRMAGVNNHPTKNTKSNKKNKKQRELLTRLALIAGLIILLVVIIVVCISASKSVKAIKIYEVEAGTKDPITASCFLKKAVNGATITDDTYFDLSKIGDYEIKIQYGKKILRSTLRVVDTVSPSGVPHSLLVSVGASVSPEDVIDQSAIYDETEVTLGFENEIDTSKAGTVYAVLVLTDQAGNVSKFNITVYVIESVNEVTWEIGDAYPVVSDFLPDRTDAHFTQDLSSMSINKPGTYHIGVNLGGFEYKVTLIAVDTIAPIASANEGISLYQGDEIPTPISLVKDVIDRTQVTASFKENYSTANCGILSVIVVLTDEGGNTTEVNVAIAVRMSNADDITPPIITINPSLVEISVGDALPFAQYVTIVDNFDGTIDVYDDTRVSIDKSLFNNCLAGTYTIKITAVDSAGNIATSQMTVIVKNLVITKEQTYEIVDQILAKKIKSTMTREEKIRAVWSYCRSTSNMTYTDVSDKTNDYITEAYYGFVNKVGDCYTYYSMAAAMLDRLDIAYYTVQRVPGARTKHWWLLVDFGDGWYHVDPCYHSPTYTIKRSDGTAYETFKLTDAELLIFTEHMEKFHVNWQYYVFDHTNYPATPILNSDGNYTYQKYTMVYSAQTGGRIEGNAKQSVAHGADSTPVSAVAGTGYRFVKWSDGSTNATRSDTLYCDKEITALFERDGTVEFHTLKYTAGSGGRVSGNATQDVVAGTYGTTVYAVAYSGYEFIGWSDGVKRTTRTDLANADLEVKALFQKVEQTETTYKVSYEASEGGYIDGTASQDVKSGEYSVSVTAVANEGYHFVSWSDGNTEATRSDNLNSDCTFKANFAPDGVESVTIEYTAGEGGTIVGKSTQTLEIGLSTSSVTATANEGYHFVSWSDGNTESTRSDTANADTTYTAIFEKDAEETKYMVYYIATYGGRIEGQADQLLNAGETTSTVTAVAQEGYYFVIWSDGNSEASRSDVVSGDLTLNAIFMPQ